MGFNPAGYYRHQRWLKASKEDQHHMKEETSLMHKIKDITTLMDGNKITIGDLLYENSNKLRVVEWGLDILFGIKVNILRMDKGLRFEKLAGSAPILNDEREAAGLGIGKTKSFAKSPAFKANSMIYRQGYADAARVLKESHPEQYKEIWDRFDEYIGKNSSKLNNEEAWDPITEAEYQAQYK